MNCSAQEIVDAIITAGARRGSDGRGKDGLNGHMSTATCNGNLNASSQECWTPTRTRTPMGSMG